MKTLILSYFDLKAGPRVFLQVPEILEDEDLKQIFTLLDLHREGFFAHVFKNFRTANYVFEIPNINIRGSREILLISLVVDITQDLNLTLSRELLEDFAEEMNEIVDVYKALHAHSTGYKDAYDKFIEVKELLSTFHKSFKPAMKALKVAELRYQALFKAARDTILIIDRKSGIIIDANDEAERLFRRPRGRIIGLNSIHLNLTCEDENLTDYFLKRVELKDDSTFIAQITNSIGENITVEVSGSEIKIGDQHLAQFILHNITERLYYENQLIESEEKYRLISENANELITVINNKFKYEYMNEQPFIKQLGYSSEDIIGRSVWRFIHPDDLRESVEKFRDEELHKNFEQELRIKHKDGHWVWFGVRGKTLIDENGDIKFLFFSRDISERKKAQQKLVESEEKYRLITENINDVICILNTKFVMEFVNEKALFHTVGYNKEEVIGKSILNFVQTEEIGEVVEVLKEGFKLGGGTAIGKFKHKHGHWVWIEVKGTTFIDENGETKALIIARDVSERKKAEQSLSESEEKYRLITENSNDLIALFNTKFEHTYINEQTYMKILGYSNDDMLGKTNLDLIHPDDLEQAVKAEKDGIRTGVGKVELRIRHKKGHYLWFEFQGQKYIDREGNTKGLIVGRDITDRKKAKEELMESEEKYRLITENANDLIVVLNENFEYEFINEKVHQRIMGYSKEDMIGKSSFSFVHPDDLGEATKTLRKGFKIGEGEGEARIRNKKGVYVWLEVKGRTFIDKDGKTKVLLISRNITDRKISEQLLKESEEKYRLISENANDLISVFNENFEHEYINESIYLKILGYSKGDLLGTYALDLVHPDDSIRIANEIRKSLKTGEVRYEVRAKHKDGHWIWLEVKGTFFNNYKEERKFLLIGRDITERRSADQKLRKSEEKYRFLFNQSPFSIFIFNSDGIITDCNPTTQELFEYERDELIGRHFENVSIMAPKDLPLFFKLFKEFLQGTQINPIDLQVYKSDGTLFWSNLQFSLVNIRNRTYVKGIFRDISEKKMSDLKLEESEKKYRQAYEVANFYRELFAHDMNNILQNFQYSVELISCFTKDSINLDELIEVSGVLEREVIRGIKLVSNILKISTLEEAQIPTESVDALKVLNDTFKFIHKNFREKEINIDLKTPNDKLLILANQLLADLFETILIHAIKYNVNPVKKIQIKTSEEQKDDVNYLKIEFIDNGMGISDERKDKIFKRAYDGGRGTREMEIGFLLIKQIIDNYNGEIIVENRIKDDYTKGSNFIVLIPAAS